MLRTTRLLGMRWWLGLAFAAVAALTAVAVVAVLNSRAERAVRASAREFAVGNAVAASETLKRDTSVAELRRDIAQLAARRRMALFAFDAHGRPLTPATSFGLPLERVPMRAPALREALASNRFIQSSRDGTALVVGLPIHGGPAAALVAFSLRPELVEQLGIVQNQYVAAALFAFAVGAAAGLVIASLIAYRLARIARAARAIGTGDFSVVAPDRFPDEVGSLAHSIDGMRLQLQSLVRALEEDRDRLEGLLDRLNDGVLVLDRSLGIEFANGQAHELLGEGEPLVGRNLAELPRAAPLTAIASDLFAQGEPAHRRLATDDDRLLLVSGIPPGASGENAIVVIADESQKERTERAQREFATNAAHELRTPLSSIVSAVELLQTGAKDEPEARDRFLALIEREAARLSRLTRALLVLARAEAREEAPRLEALDLRALLVEVAAGLPAAAGVEVEIDCPEGLAVLGDAELLEQALASVGANAVQHTQEGSVTLRARAAGGGTTVIEVVDTGSGIDARDRRRIFDRFYRGASGEDRAGFGLGLSIALGAVRALGGRLELESERGVGTTVRIALPAADREAVA